MIQVSETAKKKIIDLMKEDGFDAAVDYVRVGVKKRWMFAYLMI
jgi:iron-sulfur cluster assembly protein